MKTKNANTIEKIDNIIRNGLLKEGVKLLLETKNQNGEEETMFIYLNEKNIDSTMNKYNVEFHGTNEVFLDFSKETLRKTLIERISEFK